MISIRRTGDGFHPGLFISALIVCKTAPLAITCIAGIVQLFSVMIIMAEIRNDRFITIKRVAHFFYVAVFALIIFKFAYYFEQMRFFCVCDILFGIVIFFLITGVGATKVKENVEKLLFSTLCNLFALAVELLVRWASGDGFFNIPLIVIHIILGCIIGNVLFEKEEYVVGKIPAGWRYRHINNM